MSQAREGKKTEASEEDKRGSVEWMDRRRIKDKGKRVRVGEEVLAGGTQRAERSGTTTLVRLKWGRMVLCTILGEVALAHACAPVRGYIF